MENTDTKMPLDKTIKLCKLNALGKKEAVFVFRGTTEPIANMKDLFSDIETQEMTVENTKIIYSAQQIHKDDSIRILKKKIINEIGASEIFYDEIYLFSVVRTKINLLKLYQEITNNERVEFTHEMLLQLLQNLDIDDGMINEFNKKEVYRYNDLLAFDIQEHEQEIKIPLGQNFTRSQNFLFSASPFDLNGNKMPLYKTNAENPLLIFENQLVLNYGDFENNTIYFCAARDVFDFALANHIDEEYISQIYYPLLAKKEILRKSQIAENEAELVKQNKAILKPQTLKLYEIIDMFYDMHYSRKSDISYLERGVTSFHIVIHPSAKSNLPLEAIFKNIHASKDMAFIKYNPGSRKENIYRLYCEQISKYGKKIPFLPSNLIMSLSKQIGKNRQISIYTQKTFNLSLNDVFIDFEQNGNIIIRSELKTALSKIELNEFIKETLNPVIQNMNAFLEKTGYTIDPFSGFNNETVEIMDIKYKTVISKKRDFNIKDKVGCLTAVFDVIDADANDKAVLKFKRVANFQKMDAMASLINEIFRRTNSQQAVIEALMQNYNLSAHEAAVKIAQFLNGHTRMHGHFVNKSFDIAENPGFDTVFQILPFENKIMAEIDGINSVEYLDVIEIYMDSIFRMTQFPETSTITAAKIKQLCSKAAKFEDEPHVKNVVVPVGLPSIQPVKFTGKMKFPGEDEDEDTEEYKEEEDDLIVDETEDIGFIPMEDEEDEMETEPNIKNVPASATARPPVAPAAAKPNVLTKIAEAVGVAEVAKEALSPKEENEEGDEGIIFDEPSPEESPSVAAETETPEQDGTPAEEGIIFDEPSQTPDETTPTSPEILNGPSKTVEDNLVVTPSPEIETKSEEEEQEENDEEEGIIFEEEDSDEEEEPKQTAGAEPLNGEIFDDKPFKKNKIFFNKMKKLEPRLFLNKREGNFDSYARLCPTNTNRQPVILTKEEKETIDREHPGSYDKSIKYGTDPKNPYYYICPRYWCLLTNSSITEEEAKSGMCGNIIPPKADKIPKGAYVYEFTDEKVHKDKEGKYVPHNPGFMEDDKHPDGHCLPCCYSNWKTQGRKDRIEECENPDKEKAPEQDGKQQNVLYIIGVDKYPKQGRWGFLPPSVELFLDIDHNKMVTKNNPALVKQNTPILLRHGVEQSIKQSFVGCIADIYSSQKGVPVPTISEMRKIIAGAITLDMFIQYHNGSLVSVFRLHKIKVPEDIIQSHKDTVFYKSIDLQNESQFDLLEDTVAAFENFKKFLMDDNSVIDHNYLWDVVTSKNPKLFDGGFNLVILRLPNNDITDNIEIVCPVNSYSKNFYSPIKDTIILLKRDEFFEPVYLYEAKEGKIFVKKSFREESSIKNVKHVLKIIKNSMNNYCSPLSSIPPKVYTFKKNLLVTELYQALSNNNYVVDRQIINYQGKIIGLTVKKTPEDTRGVFVPCFPSASIANVPIEFMEKDIWNDYRTTVDELTEINAVAKIPCKPIIKVVENNTIVGLLTETNQFVQIFPPAENTALDELETVNNTNYIVADKVLTTYNKGDELRIKTIKNIKLETELYNTFRSTLRSLINKHKNLALREKLIKMVNNANYKYLDKLKTVETILKRVCKSNVEFVDNIPEKLLKMYLRASENDKDDEEAEAFCLIGDNEKCNLILPKKHLVSGADNEKVYYGRMADELIRYNRIRMFMFEPKTYLNISNLNYSIYDTEIIVLQSLLTHEFFENLIPYQTSKYVKNITYELAAPIDTQNYLNTNVVPLNKQTLVQRNTNDVAAMKTMCVSETRDIYGNNMSYWKQIFPKTARETVLNKENACSFYLLTTILYEKTGKVYSITDLKTMLWKTYSEYIGVYGPKMEDILFKQGKHKMIKAIQKGLFTFEAAIMSEDYYITNLDIWLIAHKMKLPVVLFCEKPFKNMVSGVKWLILSGEYDEKFYFVRSPIVIENNLVPVYQFIQPALKFDEVKGFTGMIESGISGSEEYKKSMVSLDTFLQEYAMQS